MKNYEKELKEELKERLSKLTFRNAIHISFQNEKFTYSRLDREYVGKGFMATLYHDTTLEEALYQIENFCWDFPCQILPILKSNQGIF